jgi:hypothetical protein
MNITNTARFLSATLLIAVCTSQIFATANDSMPIKYSPQTERITSLLDEVGRIQELAAPVPAAQAPDVAVGVGFVFAPYNLPPDEQATILDQMEHAGVRIVRCSISNDVKGLDFVQRVYAHKIKIIWMVGLTPEEGTPWPHAPEGFKGLWQSYPCENRGERDRVGSLRAWKRN